MKPGILLYLGLVAILLLGLLFTFLWPQNPIFYIFIILCSGIGFWVSFYIYSSKRYKKPLFCPQGENCEAVVNSRYSTFMGLPIEWLGMVYFGLIFLSYSSLSFLFNLVGAPIMLWLASISFVAFLFSLYLIFLQAFLIKEWCIWCLLISTVSTTIFIASLANIDLAKNLIAYLKEYFTLAESLGFVLGLGGSTAAAFLFIKFLEDFDISRGEAKVIRTLSELIFFGLALIWVAEYTRFIALPQKLSQDPSFLAQVITLMITSFLGMVLKLIFDPILAILPFNQSGEELERFYPRLRSMRKTLLIIGSVTLFSWYYSFFVKYIPKYPLSALMTAYFILTGGVILISIFWENTMGDLPNSDSLNKKSK